MPVLRSLHTLPQEAGAVRIVLRQPYRAGEKLLVDYSGRTLPLVDFRTGSCQESHVFVAVLGASNYTYAESQ